MLYSVDMEFREPEKILSNIVLLSATSTVVSLSHQEITSILPDVSVQALQIPAQPAAQMQLTSLRKQVQVALGTGQLIFEDRSGEFEVRSDLADITAQFIALLASKGITQYKGYGFNFHLAFDAPGELLAAQLLKDRFINTSALETRGLPTLHGAGLRLFFPVGSALCSLRLEPREHNPNSPRFFCHANYNYELTDSTLPDTALIKSDFTSKWHMLLDLLKTMILRP
jgi:hypothetical protein